MSSRLMISALFLAPIAVLVGLYGFGLTIPVPHLGRNYVLRIDLPDAGAALGLPEVKGPLDGSRPLIVIDAGHGGHDPGANGTGYQEKMLALGLAVALRDRILEQGGVRVALTRDDDRFLALGERSQIARALGADLFLSIHADSAGDEVGVAGATVYTLSDNASDEAAARLAARENRSDRINGVRLEGQSGAVSAILVDLSQRRTKEASLAFAQLIVREGTDLLAFHPRPRRAAAFAVLKSPDVPSVLFEAGYISNPEDAERLASVEGRAAFAEAAAKAVRIFFARNSQN